MITARGGSYSHGAMLASSQKMPIPCIVGVQQLCYDVQSGKWLLGDTVINEGDVLSIDGDKGTIYLGRVELKLPNPAKGENVSLDEVQAVLSDPATYSVTAWEAQESQDDLSDEEQILLKFAFDPADTTILDDYKRLKDTQVAMKVKLDTLLSAIEGLKARTKAILCVHIAGLGHRPGILIFHLASALFQLPYTHIDPLQNIQRFKSRHNNRHLEFFGN